MEVNKGRFLSVTLLVIVGFFLTSLAGAERSAQALPVEALIQQLRDEDPAKACTAAKARMAIALALFRITGEKDLVFPVWRETLVGPEEHDSIYYRPDRTRTARVLAARALGVLAENGDERARMLIVETAKGDENPHVRLAALEALARLKPVNANGVTGLQAVLRHSDAQIRAAAASALGRLGPHAKGSRPALQAATQDSHLPVRQAARQVLDLLN
jgi:HEAT repeat protein